MLQSIKRDTGHANHRNGEAVTLAPSGRYCSQDNLSGVGITLDGLLKINTDDSWNVVNALSGSGVVEAILVVTISPLILPT